jgi:hypothetical protein
MQFMADIYLKCEGCGGKRFKQEILEVTLQDKNVSDILEMTVDEAIDFFRKADPKMADKLRPLQDVGLGYIGLGQSSNTLSGGEAQRVKEIPTKAVHYSFSTNRQPGFIFTISENYFRRSTLLSTRVTRLSLSSTTWKSLRVLTILLTSARKVETLAVISRLREPPKKW